MCEPAAGLCVSIQRKSCCKDSCKFDGMPRHQHAPLRQQPTCSSTGPANSLLQVPADAKRYTDSFSSVKPAHFPGEHLPTFNCQAPLLQPNQMYQHAVNGLADRLAVPLTDREIYINTCSSVKGYSLCIQASSVAGGTFKASTTDTFPASRHISGALISLKPGGLREPHWHAPDEWAYVVSGTCR